MAKKHWTTAELAAGYRAMAQLNRQLTAEFAPLEEEASTAFLAAEPAEEDK